MTDEHAGELGEVYAPPQAQRQPAPPSLWERIRRLFAPAAQTGGDLLHALDEAIAADPEAVVNYVARGEHYLKHSQPDLAAGDFRRALELAAAQMQTNNWGIIAQAMQDRAIIGLREAERYVRDLPQQPDNRLLDEDVAEGDHDRRIENQD